MLKELLCISDADVLFWSRWPPPLSHSADVALTGIRLQGHQPFAAGGDCYRYSPPKVSTFLRCSKYCGVLVCRQFVDLSRWFLSSWNALTSHVLQEWPWHVEERKEEQQEGGDCGWRRSGRLAADQYALPEQACRRYPRAVYTVSLA
jgi:hypothetical protein